MNVNSPPLFTLVHKSDLHMNWHPHCIFIWSHSDDLSFNIIWIFEIQIIQNSNIPSCKTTIREESGIIRCKICRHKKLCHNQKARLQSVYENHARPVRIFLSFWSYCEKPVMKLQSDWLVGFYRALLWSALQGMRPP